MKKRITSLLLALCLLARLTPVLAAEASGTECEKAWYPAARMYIVQIAYEANGTAKGASHSGYNTIDIANTTDLKAADKRIFAPFTGIIVYRNTNYGYVLLQSRDKVLYADGTEDYMTVGFMHDNDISDLPLGKVIQQGEAFYDAGNTSGGKIQKDMGYHVQISVFKGRFFNVSGPKSDGTYTIGKQLRKFKNGKLSPGDVYAFDAFFVNTGKTKANQYTEVGCLAKGHTVSEKGAPENWSGRWRDLDGNPFPSVPTISAQNAPGALKAGQSFSIKGTVSAKTKLTAVTAGVYTAESGGTMKTGKSVSLSPVYKSTNRVTSYNLNKLASSVKFNTLPAGTYWYRVTAAGGAGTVTLVNARFTVGNAASPGKTDTGGTAAPPAQPDTPSQSPSAQSPAQSAPLPAGTTETPSWWPSQTTGTESADTPQHPALGWYTLTPACAPDLRLDVAYSGTSSGDTVWTWEANGTPAQLWYVHPNRDADDFYSIRAGVDPSINMCLDVQYGGLTSGTPVWQYEENGSQAQDWMFLDAGDGYYYIVPRENQDLTLAIKNGSAEECGELIIETRNGSSGQKWLLTKYG